MTTEYETAYRRLNDDISERDLRRLFSPSKKDLDVIHGIAKKPYSRLGLTIYFKAFQYLGYFVLLKHVPERIKAHIALALGYKRLPPAYRLEAYDGTKSKRDHLTALRRILRVEPFELRAHRGWVEGVARDAAQTKHNIPDIINQLIDELIRRRFELPVYSVLEDIAREARTAIHDQYLSRLSEALSPAGRAMIDGLLKRGSDPLIHAATNKSEQFNGFMRLVFFGGEGVVAENMRHEQQKLVKWAHLAANLIILHNVNEMTRVLRELEAEGYELTEEAMAGTSPFRMGHLNRLGVMLVDSNRQSDPSNAEWQPKSAEANHETPTVH